MTTHEYDMYLSICNSYHQGKDLFKGLFETDEDGVIVCLNPPKKQFSMEVVIFLQNLMVHQHMRKVYKEHDAAMTELKDLISKAQKLIKPLKESSKD